MATSIHGFQNLFIRTAAVALIALAITGCSATQTSYVVEPQMPVSPNAVVSAEQAFVPETFSLVAADSIGLATFGYEIALWDELGPAELITLYNQLY